MTAMIKLRHQQPSLWHRGLAEDIESGADLEENLITLCTACHARVHGR